MYTFALLMFLMFLKMLSSQLVTFIWFINFTSCIYSIPSHYIIVITYKNIMLICAYSTIRYWNQTMDVPKRNIYWTIKALPNGTIPTWGAGCLGWTLRATSLLRFYILITVGCRNLFAWNSCSQMWWQGNTEWLISISSMSSELSQELSDEWTKRCQCYWPHLGRVHSNLARVTFTWHYSGIRLLLWYKRYTNRK